MKIACFVLLTIHKVSEWLLKKNFPSLRLKCRMSYGIRSYCYIFTLYVNECKKSSKSVIGSSKTASHFSKTASYFSMISSLNLITMKELNNGMRGRRRRKKYNCCIGKRNIWIRILN